MRADPRLLSLLAFVLDRLIRPRLLLDPWLQRGSARPGARHQGARHCWCFICSIRRDDELTQDKLLVFVQTAHVPTAAPGYLYSSATGSRLSPIYTAKLGSNLEAAVVEARASAPETTSLSRAVADALLDKAGPLFEGLDADQRVLAEGLAVSQLLAVP